MKVARFPPGKRAGLTRGFLRDLHDAEDHPPPPMMVNMPGDTSWQVLVTSQVPNNSLAVSVPSSTSWFPHLAFLKTHQLSVQRRWFFFSQAKMVCFFFPCQCHGMAVWHPPPKMLNAMPLLRSMLPSLCTWFAALGPVALNLDSKPALWQTDWLITTSLQ